ncbi:MAG: prepilin-type N-terminal cleavage/methylation domain-containing protein [Gammaproteobacteria bacterium]|nr:prepilin-type N-terminal cleavage/methylation domain-containing protein [Gammaproteobacteria bacterium]
MRKSGFTLLEVIIAMTIFAMIALITTATLHHAIIAEKRQETDNQRLIQLQKTIFIINRDIEELADRSTLKISDTSNNCFNLVTLGKTQPNTIKYCFTKNQLIRNKTILLNNIKSFSFNILKIKNNPSALQLTIKLKDLGVITRTFYVPQNDQQ